MLKIHEHIIEVSNPQDDLAGIFDSSMLWRHLEHFARHPTEYVEVMKQCSITEHYENEQLLLKRELDFGGLIVSDTVTFDVGHAVITDVKGSKDYPASRFTIQIESLVKRVISFCALFMKKMSRKRPHKTFICS